MEAATPPTTPAPEAVEETATAVETSPAESRHPQELFKYSAWVHVGPGAEECEGREDGSCTNGMHFHAWCRLPNQFQHQSIREKAQAAKARRARQFRDLDSDASITLDSTLDEIESAMGEEAVRNTYIEEIVYKDFMRDYFNVVQELQNLDPEEDAEQGPWATIDEDKERLRVLESMPAEERPDDEYEELTKHVTAYGQEIERRIKEDHQDPLRQALQGKSLDELRAMVREERVNKDVNGVYMQTYTIWEQYIGTMKPQPQGMPGGKTTVPTERVFKDINHLKEAAPEIVDALDRVYTDLDGEFGKTLAPSAGKGS